MPFTIQDIAKFLINPFIPLFVLLVIQLFRKKRGKRLLFVLFLYVYLISIPATSKFIIPFWLLEDTFDDSETYDAVVVLSGFSDSKWYLARENKPVLLKYYYRLNQNADRIITGAELLLTGHAGQLLIADPYYFNGFSEAQLVKKFLEVHDIPPEQIVVYGEVENTLEEAQKVKQYINQNRINKIVLVTSALHMRRAVALFNKQGLSPAYLSVLRPNTSLILQDFIPTTSGMRQFHGISYEVVGYVGYWMLSKI